jgi:hypothetical protein
MKRFAEVESVEISANVQNCTYIPRDLLLMVIAARPAGG